MFCNSLCHNWWYGITHLLVLTCLAAQENEIIRKRLDSCTFTNRWNSIPFIMEMMPMSRVNGDTWLLTVQASPRYMNLSGFLQLPWQIFIISTIRNHCYNAFGLFIMKRNVVIPYHIAACSHQALIVTTGSDGIWGFVCDGVLR